MMDHYSHQPAPNLEDAKQEIKLLGLIGGYCPLWHSNEDVYVEQLISEAFDFSMTLDKNNKIKYSYSGWYTFGKRDVLKSIDIILMKRKKNKLRRKIRGILRTSYLLMKAHNTSIKKLYHPDSQFVNNVLKTKLKKNASNSR